MARARQVIAALLLGLLFCMGGAAALSLSVHSLSPGAGEALELAGSLLAAVLVLFSVGAVARAVADQRRAATPDQRIVALATLREYAIRLVAKLHLAAALWLLYAARFHVVLLWLRGHPLTLYLLIFSAVLALTVNQAADIAWRRGWYDYTAAYRSDGTPRLPGGT